MSRIYSNPERENDTYALPDVEVFYADKGEVTWEGQEGPSEAGYYYWYCFPGCMPEGDAQGPFETEEEAIQAAQDEAAE